MIDRILVFSYGSITANEICERVSAVPKFLWDPHLEKYSIEVISLKKIIEEKGMPSPNVYRGTFLSYSNNGISNSGITYYNPDNPWISYYRPEIPWIYYYIPKEHSFPIILNTHQARHLFKDEEFERNQLLERPNEQELLLTIKINEKINLYAYRACVSHHKRPYNKTYTYFIVKEIIYDGGSYYSHPLFMKPAEFEEMKTNPDNFKKIVNRFF